MWPALEPSGGHLAWSIMTCLAAGGQSCLAAGSQRPSAVALPVAVLFDLATSHVIKFTNFSGESVREEVRYTSWTFWDLQ